MSRVKVAPWEMVPVLLIPYISGSVTINVSCIASVVYCYHLYYRYYQDRLHQIDIYLPIKVDYTMSANIGQETITIVQLNQEAVEIASIR